MTVALSGLALLAGAASSAPVATCRPTPEDAFGPFGRVTPPLRAKIGTGHVLTGVVLSALDCKPIRGARVEFWQSNRQGVYTRSTSGSVRTNAQGRFRFEGPYPASYGGPAAHPHPRRREVPRGAPNAIRAARRAPRSSPPRAQAPAGLRELAHAAGDGATPILRRALRIPRRRKSPASASSPWRSSPS